MKNNKSKTVANGQCYTNTGHRTVVIDPTNFQPRPVVFAKQSGYQSDRATFQELKYGDLVFTVMWNSKGEDYNLKIEGVQDIPTTEQYPYWKKLKDRHPNLDAFLNRDGRGASYLPGVEERDFLSNKYKIDRLTKCSNRFGLNLDVELFWKSKKDDLQTYPRPLDLDIDNYQPYIERVIGCMVDIHREEYWYGSDGHGTCIPLGIDPTVDFKSNYAHEKPDFKQGQPGIPGWRDHKFVIRIQRGIYTRDHYSYGYGIDIWEVNPKK